MATLLPKLEPKTTVDNPEEIAKGQLKNVKYDKKQNSLDLSGIDLSTEIGKNFLRNLYEKYPNVKTLNLSNTKIEPIQLQLLISCQNLISLDLSGNPNLIQLKNGTTELSSIIPENLLNQLDSLNLSNSIKSSPNINTELKITSKSLNHLALSDIKINKLNLTECSELTGIQIFHVGNPNKEHGINFIEPPSKGIPYINEDHIALLSTPADEIFIEPSQRIDYEKKSLDNIISDLNFLESLRPSNFKKPGGLKERQIPFYQSSLDSKFGSINRSSTEKRIYLLKELALKKTQALIQKLNPTRQNFDTQTVSMGYLSINEGIQLKEIEGVRYSSHDNIDKQSFELEIPENIPTKQLEEVLKAVLSLCTNIQKIYLKGAGLSSLANQETILKFIKENNLQKNPIKEIVLPEPSDQNDQNSTMESYNKIFPLMEINRPKIKWIG